MDNNLQEHEVEICVNEEGPLKVFQCNLRSTLRWLRLEGLERHRVAGAPNCSPAPCQSVHDYTFLHFLKVFFLITLSLGLINIIILHQVTEHRLTYWDFQTGLLGTILTVCAVAVFFTAFVAVTTRHTSSAPTEEEEVKTISAFIQNVQLKATPL